MIKLDHLFYIEVDSFNCTLVRKEEKTIERKGKLKDVVSVQHWHYSNIKQCLSKYVTESLKPLEEIQQLLAKLVEIETTINKVENRT